MVVDADFCRTEWYSEAVQRVFRTRTFSRWMRKAGVTDAGLHDAVVEMPRI
jgi:hypothetical protein